MRIDGKKIQQELLENLKKEISDIKNSGKNIGIGIVTLGDEETWKAYVGQKIKLAKELGIEAKLINLRPKSTEDVIETLIGLNSDKTISGLIVQRPFPSHIDTERVIQNISKDRDIDGFGNNSKFEVPVFLAVLLIIRTASQLTDEVKFQEWLSNQSILIVGKGETAGQPCINGFKKTGILTSFIDSKTMSREELFKKANIIISATGKNNLIPLNLLQKGSILIGIGLHRENGLLVGDFDEFEAEKQGLIFTPSPGGVGPLNLYYLFKNLVTAAKEN